MSVIIGVDPHKATHTAVAINRSEVELARARIRATVRQVPQLLDWAEPLGERTWAIESADGLGYLLSQQLIGAGKHVFAGGPTALRLIGSVTCPNGWLQLAYEAAGKPTSGNLAIEADDLLGFVADAGTTRATLLSGATQR